MRATRQWICVPFSIKQRDLELTKCLRFETPPRIMQAGKLRNYVARLRPTGCHIARSLPSMCPSGERAQPTFAFARSPSSTLCHTNLTSRGQAEQYFLFRTRHRYKQRLVQKRRGYAIELGYINWISTSRSFKVTTKKKKNRGVIAMLCSRLKDSAPYTSR